MLFKRLRRTTDVNQNNMGVKLMEKLFKHNVGFINIWTQGTLAQCCKATYNIFCEHSSAFEGPLDKAVECLPHCHGVKKVCLELSGSIPDVPEVICPQISELEISVDAADAPLCLDVFRIFGVRRLEALMIRLNNCPQYQACNEWLVPLLSNPCLSRLKSLTIHGVSLAILGDIMVTVLSSRSFPDLHTLNLGQPGLHPRGLGMGLSRQDYENLDNVVVTPELFRLLNKETVGQLRKLMLWGRVGEMTPQFPWLELESLYIGFNSCAQQVVKQLMTSDDANKKDLGAVILNELPWWCSEVSKHVPELKCLHTPHTVQAAIPLLMKVRATDPSLVDLRDAIGKIIINSLQSVELDNRMATAIVEGVYRRRDNIFMIFYPVPIDCWSGFNVLCLMRLCVCVLGSRQVSRIARHHTVSVLVRLMEVFTAKHPNFLVPEHNLSSKYFVHEVVPLLLKERGDQEWRLAQLIKKLALVEPGAIDMWIGQGEGVWLAMQWITYYPMMVLDYSTLYEYAAKAFMSDPELMKKFFVMASQQPVEEEFKPLLQCLLSMYGDNTQAFWSVLLSCEYFKNQGPWILDTVMSTAQEMNICLPSKMLLSFPKQAAECIVNNALLLVEDYGQDWYAYAIRVVFGDWSSYYDFIALDFRASLTEKKALTQSTRSAVVAYLLAPKCDCKVRPLYDGIVPKLAGDRLVAAISRLISPDWENILVGGLMEIIKASPDMDVLRSLACGTSPLFKSNYGARYKTEMKVVRLLSKHAGTNQAVARLLTHAGQLSAEMLAQFKTFNDDL